MKKESSNIAFFEKNSWYHRVKILNEDGTVKYGKRGGFQSASEAEESYRKYEDEFKKAYRAYHISRKVNTDITLKEYLIYWFEDVYSGRIENTTRMLGAYTLYDLLLPNMEQEIKLKYVNVEYLDSLLLVVSRICASSGEKSREFLNLAFKDAVIEGFINTNPIPNTKPYPRKKPSITILSKEALKVFLKAAAKTEWYLEILLGLFCGLRKGEILGLKFGDIDMENNTISIQRQVTSNPVIPKGERQITSYTVEEKAPKTENSIRTLRVPEAVMEQIRIRAASKVVNMDKLGERYMDHGYVSCQENGMTHSTSAMNTALTRMCQRNGLPHITVHGLRHMYATILIEQGVPLVKISALLGHASINTTFEYYCDVMDENEEIISFMNNKFIPEV